MNNIFVIIVFIYHDNNDNKYKSSGFVFMKKNKARVKNPGQALDINTINDTWFIFPQTKDEVVTKIHFTVEALYAKYKKEKGI